MSEETIGQMKLLVPQPSFSRSPSNIARLNSQKSSANLMRRQSTILSQYSENLNDGKMAKLDDPMVKKKIMTERLNHTKISFPIAVCNSSRGCSQLARSLKKSHISSSTPRLIVHKKSKSSPVSSVMLTQSKRAIIPVKHATDIRQINKNNETMIKFAEFMDKDFGYDSYRIQNLKNEIVPRQIKAIRKGSSFDRSIGAEEIMPPAMTSEPEFGQSNNVRKLVKKASSIMRRKALQAPMDEDTKNKILVFQTQKDLESRYKHFKTFEGIKKGENPNNQDINHSISLPINMNLTLKDHLHQNRSNSQIYSNYCQYRQSELKNVMAERQMASRKEMQQLSHKIKIRDKNSKDALSKEQHLLRMNLIKVAKETMVVQGRLETSSTLFNSKTKSKWLEAARKNANKPTMPDDMIVNLIANKLFASSGVDQIDGFISERLKSRFQAKEPSESPKIMRKYYFIY